MYLSQILLAFTGFLILGHGAPASKHVLHEKREIIAPRWSIGKRVPPAAKMPMRIGLTQRNLENAHEHLVDV